MKKNKIPSKMYPMLLYTLLKALQTREVKTMNKMFAYDLHHHLSSLQLLLGSSPK